MQGDGPIIKNVNANPTSASFPVPHGEDGSISLQVDSHKRSLRHASLVPRPSTPPVFDRLQYAKTEGEGASFKLSAESSAESLPVIYPRPPTQKLR